MIQRKACTVARPPSNQGLVRQESAGRLGYAARTCLTFIVLLIPAATVVCADRSESAASAADAQSSEAIGRQALQSLGNLPWYDDASDRVKAMRVESTDAADDDVEARSTGYEQTGSKPKNFNPKLSFWETLGRMMSWTLLTGLLLLLIAAIAYAFMIYNRSQSGGSGGGVSESDGGLEDQDMEERLERLPVQIDHPASNLLAEAQRLMNAGRYNEAIVYLFSHELVQLDRHQLLRLARGKTNRQYLREIRQSYDLREILQQTMQAFEDSFFGDHAITRQRFQTCWNQLDRFHAAVEHSVDKGASA